MSSQSWWTRETDCVVFDDTLRLFLEKNCHRITVGSVRSFSGCATVIKMVKNPHGRSSHQKGRDGQLSEALENVWLCIIQRLIHRVCQVRQIPSRAFYCPQLSSSTTNDCISTPSRRVPTHIYFLDAPQNLFLLENIRIFLFHHFSWLYSKKSFLSVFDRVFESFLFSP